MEHPFSRTQMLLGKDAMDKLSAARVAVFGVGGVGGYVVEALARAGVGQLDLIDSDTVSLSNLNRQILATTKTVGQYKVDVAEARVHEINPACHVRTYKIFFLPETKNVFDFSAFDYVVDAIDTVSGKLGLIECAKEAAVPIICSMGAGNKMDASLFRVADIYETSVDPLARVIRYECRKRGIKSLKVVYSTEPPLCPAGNTADSEGKRSVPGSVSFVPGTAGLILAGEVVRDLTGFHRHGQQPHAYSKTGE